jgi:hypothetical protein
LVLNLRCGFILNLLSSFWIEFWSKHAWASHQLSNAQICAFALSHLNVVAFNIHDDNEITMFSRDNYLGPLSSNTTLSLFYSCL